MQDPTVEERTRVNNVNEETSSNPEIYSWAILYERWGENLEAAAHQVADLAELTKVLEKRINSLDKLEAKRREEMTLDLQRVISDAATSIGETVSKTASYEVAAAVSQFQAVVKKSEVYLRRYERENRVVRWLYAGGLFLMAVIVALLVARYIMPTPYLPLAEEQLQTYNNGKFLEAVWPLLPDREKRHLSNLAGKVVYSLQG